MDGPATPRRPFRAWAVLLASVACCAPPSVERDPEPHTQTSGLEYALERHDIGYSSRIPYTFTNRSSATVRFGNCDQDIRPLLQVRRDGRWVDAWYPLMRTCESAPLEVPPGDVRADTLTLVGAPPGSNVSPNFVFEDVEGVYRLYWFQAELAEAARPPDDAWRVSNPFVLALR